MAQRLQHIKDARNTLSVQIILFVYWNLINRLRDRLRGSYKGQQQQKQANKRITQVMKQTKRDWRPRPKETKDGKTTEPTQQWAVGLGVLPPLYLTDKSN